MDTNRNTANNYQINTFTKGMNSDTSYDMIGADQYLFGQNIRITNNTLVYGGTQSANRTEGIVTPVPVGKEISTNIPAKEILACTSIGDLGVVIVSGVEDGATHIYTPHSSPRGKWYWHVYKVEKVGEELQFTDWFRHSPQEQPQGTFSAVLHKEKEDVINLYIADGVHPVIQMNMYGTEKPTTDIDYLISNRLMPTDRLILSKTAGRLKTQQLQYTYRLYKKHGTFTKLAPLTNKFQVIDSNRNKEQGNAEDTRTSMGFQIKLDLGRDWQYYDYIQIYRVSYIKPNEVPKIYLIHDDYISDYNNLTIVDKGDEELQELSLDEFSALNGQIIIPKSIESNQGYLFAGNVKDDTTFYVDLEEIGINYTEDNKKPATSDIISPNISLIGTTSVGDLRSYFLSRGYDLGSQEQISYNDISCSSLLRSLRKGETYRYGIVLYDKYGSKSNVIKIEDVVADNNGRNLDVYTTGDQLAAQPIGLKFTLNDKLFNVPGREIVGYQIVRCAKTDDYSNTILQVALSRPSMQSRYEEDRNGNQVSNPSYRTPLSPNVFMSTQFLYIMYLRPDSTTDLWKSYFNYAGTNVENLTVYQIFAPEINYARKDTRSALLQDTVTLNPIHFAYIDKDLGEIITDFETAPPALDKPGYIKYIYQASDHEDRLEGITNPTVHSYSQAQINNGEAYTSSSTHRTLHLFIPSGYNADFYAMANIGSNGWENVEYKYIKKVYDEIDHISYRYYVASLDTTSSWQARVVTTERSSAYGDSVLDLASGNYTSTLKEDHNPDRIFVSVRSEQQYLKEDKSQSNAILKLYDRYKFNSVSSVAIEDVADVKNPNWDQGFSSVQLAGDEEASVLSAIKQYKSFTSNIGNKTFVNWVANGMYDLAPSENDAKTQLGNKGASFVFHTIHKDKDDIDLGWIGPGPLSLLIKTADPTGVLTNQVVLNNKSLFGTTIANIKHTKLEYNDSYTPYYGFGNYFSADQTTATVFDGDIYITPAEFVNMYKAYDFNDQLTNLMSGQVVYYIPMESRINTFFDYGMNYRNTSSTTLMLEPGEITGIASQSRPLHQYNMIYSDNNTSIDVFTPQTDKDKDAINNIPHRICYSQLKTDGENIDNWQIFRPADFIDVDSRYGEITHLLTSDNTLYYWQNNAFGKLSVNERSLVKDENSNSIQLGTGGVLNRYDYLSTRYGMKVDHRAAIAAEHGVYWIDTANKAIPAYTGNGVINIAEMYNVQNLVNEHMDDDNPSIDYDLQSYELLCKIAPEYGLAINLKLQCCTSVYTREYTRCIDLNNTLYHLGSGYRLSYRKANYIQNDDEYEMLPVKLSFAVNPQASLTKVYDNQKMVFVKDPVTFNTWTFETDYQSVSTIPEVRSDRENNIWYPMPRTNGATFNEGFGGRMRGKWLKQDITMNNPTEFGLSCIITKFRQSYS